MFASRLTTSEGIEIGLPVLYERVGQSWQVNIGSTGGCIPADWVIGMPDGDCLQPGGEAPGPVIVRGGNCVSPNSYAYGNTILTNIKITCVGSVSPTAKSMDWSAVSAVASPVGQTEIITSANEAVCHECHNRSCPNIIVCCGDQVIVQIRVSCPEGKWAPTLTPEKPADREVQ